MEEEEEQEGESQEQEESQEHAMRLLNEYKAREAVQQVEVGDKAGKAGKRGSSGGVDQYERSVPSHGDEYFHNFVSVIKKHPAQILRYDRLSGSGPLLLSPLPQHFSSVRCQYCAGQITFEFQLLPSLGELSVTVIPANIPFSVQCLS